MKSILPKTLLCISTLSLIAVLGACRKKEAKQQAPPPAEVSVVTVASERVNRTTELPGRINSVREAQVRARATGILLKRLFEEGSNVKEGQVLFEIDPAPLQASFNSAKASMAKTEAALKESQATVDRYKELVPINAISKQVYDQSVAMLGQNEAELLAAKAAIQTAELNLGYAQVSAPISGRIGKALVTEGALVSATEATQLAVIRQLDPVYFDFTQSSIEVLRLKRALEKGTLESVATGRSAGNADAGRRHYLSARGQVVVLRYFGRSDHRHDHAARRSSKSRNLLMPGMFARAQIIEGVNTNAVTIPQRTITRGAAGAATVLVVNAENKVEARNIETDRTVGTKVLVSKGLKPGERIIVEGSQKAPPGSAVKPVPFTAPAAADLETRSKSN